MKNILKYNSTYHQVKDLSMQLVKLFEKCNMKWFPYIWKTVIVIPLNKNGLMHLKSNYWSISLTCILCKVFEKLIRNHIPNFMRVNMNYKQHGFIYGKSALSNILESIDMINEYLMEGDNADIIYLDFSKAFDTAFHYYSPVTMKKVRNIIRWDNFW